MKKNVLVLLIFIGCLISVLSAETVYVLSSEDYYMLCARIWAMNRDRASLDDDLPLFKAYAGLDYLQDIKNNLKPIELPADKELTTDQKLSNLGGKITLLEMRIIQLENKK